MHCVIYVQCIVGFVRLVYWGSNWQLSSIRSDNGLAPNRHKVITWRLNTRFIYRVTGRTHSPHPKAFISMVATRNAWSFVPETRHKTLIWRFTPIVRRNCSELEYLCENIGTWLSAWNRWSKTVIPFSLDKFIPITWCRQHHQRLYGTWYKLINTLVSSIVL